MKFLSRKWLLEKKMFGMSGKWLQFRPCKGISFLPKGGCIPIIPNARYATEFSSFGDMYSVLSCYFIEIIMISQHVVLYILCIFNICWLVLVTSQWRTGGRVEGEGSLCPKDKVTRGVSLSWPSMKWPGVSSVCPASATPEYPPGLGPGLGTPQKLAEVPW